MTQQPAESRDFDQLLHLIWCTSCHDLSSHRVEPIVLHLHRHMQRHGVETLAEYLRLVRNTPREVTRLHHDILNGATGFFRDDASQVLKSQVFASLLVHKAQGPIRVWVPACATGQEPYSIAICWLEFLAEHELQVPLEIIATDVDATALLAAERAVYSGAIAREVSASRLARFFEPLQGGYRVSAPVRALVRFSWHDATQPFPQSNLDMVSCRNLLIYLRASAQRQLLSSLRNSLREGSRLLLGNCETIGNATELFSLVDSAHRLYEAKAQTGSPSQ